MDNYLTADEVAKLVKLSLTSVRRLTMNNEIPFYKINRSVRYKSEDIELWLANKKNSAEQKSKKKSKAVGSGATKKEVKK